MRRLDVRPIKRLEFSKEMIVSIKRIIVPMVVAVFVTLTACTSPLVGDLTSISILPPVGSYITNSQNVSSEVLLKDVQVNKVISNKQYISPWYPPGTVSVGESILIVSGSIQNKHQENKEIAMYAEGYDDNGKQVSWTLDATHIIGQIGLHLENEEVSQFILHLNMVENIRSIRIFANNYSVTPP